MSWHTRACAQRIAAVERGTIRYSLAPTVVGEPTTISWPDLELLDDLEAAGDRLVGGAGRHSDVVEEGVVAVVRAEDEALVHPALAAPPPHPAVGNRLTLVGKQMRREALDVHPERVGERDAPPGEGGAVGTEGGGRVGVAAGEMVDALALEDLVAGRRRAPCSLDGPRRAARRT